MTWALKDADAETRSMAAYLLGRLRTPEAGPALVEALDDPSEAVRMVALSALARIGDKRAVRAVARTAERDASLAVSVRAIDVLAKLGDPSGVAGLVSLLTNRDSTRLISTASPKVKWGLQKWAARRLVELRARQAELVVRAAASHASSFRERLLLRRTAWRLRHPPRGRLRGYLWWWVALLGVFVVAAWITGNGSTAWTITQYFGLSVVGLVVLLALAGRLRR